MIYLILGAKFCTRTQVICYNMIIIQDAVRLYVFSWSI